MTDDVKWAYFFCHEYVSSESSFLRRRRAGRFAAAGRRSVIYISKRRKLSSDLSIKRDPLSSCFPVENSPSTSLAGAEYVGSLMYCAGELCKQMMGNDGLSVRWMRMREHSSEMSNRVNCT